MLCTIEKESWMPGAIFCLKSKSYLGFMEQFAKVQHGAGENPSGTRESCVKLGANSASTRSQTLAGSKMWKSSSAGSPGIAGCEQNDSWCHQPPSEGRRYLQWGWSTQITCWLHSTPGAFLREQKTLNGEIKHRLYAQINTCSDTVCWTWTRRSGVQPLWQLMCPLSTIHFLEKWPVAVFTMRSCGKLSRQVGWEAEGWGARELQVHGSRSLLFHSPL